MAKIFISYKRNIDPDTKVALAIYEAFRKEHDVFIDTTLLVGENWAERIQQEIISADYLIILLSEHSVHSEMVIAEVEAAHHYHRAHSKPAILPVRLALNEALVYPLSAYLNPLQWAFWTNDTDTPRLIEELRRAIEGGVLPVNQHQIESTTVKPGEILPTAFADVSSNLGSVEGTMPRQSHFYIERVTDQEAKRAICRKEGITITIKGPRQMGKSSLLNRVLAEGSDRGMRTAFIDFQMIEHATMQNPALFYRQFCSLLSRKFKIADLTEEFWGSRLGQVQKTTDYIEGHLLSSIQDSPVLLAMDEVERMFASPFRSDFFSMLRSWHNNRAQEGDWTRLNLALVTSTEPYQLIADLNQSPFNVGIVVELTDFTPGEVAKLNERYDSPLNTTELGKLTALLGGHPYLTRKAIYLVRIGQFKFDQLMANASEDDGPFGDHLRNHLFRMADHKELKRALLNVIQDHRCADDRAFFRLKGAGLIRRQNTDVLPRNQLYSNYFSKRLNG
jgi:hypothetical protein